MMRISTTALLLAFAFGLANPVAASEIYKWTDQDGNVHYEDRPTEGAIRLTALESRPTDNARVQQSTQARRERQAMEDEAAEALAAQGPSREEVRAAAEKRAGQCQSSRNRLETMITSRRLYHEDEQGERVYLNEDEMRSARERVQSQVEEYCSG